ncbi:hypothetical protein SAMN05192534_103135 [Alteribacillus persepolensis]|uniref:Uncharacterized protein n=1 Tax=Alteribacillus persepolensis TaxID=568899 RepID=A0A1G8B3S3_9BACI|nr:hypothetical protein [Alteribacillus persepolensis]SDH27775.1 hypothetical protein SAMN05192534_103135 [Alteribacillus persepolensis]
MKDDNMNMKRQQKQCHHRYSIRLQSLLNHLLFELANGYIVTDKTLLLRIKKRWKYIDVQHFRTYGDYLIAMAKVMDEALKLFHHLRGAGNIQSAKVQDFSIVYKLPSSSCMEAWMLQCGSPDKNQYTVRQIAAWLDMAFSHREWRLTSIDVTSGIHRIEAKRQWKS